MSGFSKRKVLTPSRSNYRSRSRSRSRLEREPETSHIYERGTENPSNETEEEEPPKPKPSLKSCNLTQGIVCDKSLHGVGDIVKPTEQTNTVMWEQWIPIVHTPGDSLPTDLQLKQSPQSIQSDSRSRSPSPSRSKRQPERSHIYERGMENPSNEPEEEKPPKLFKPSLPTEQTNTVLWEQWNPIVHTLGELKQSQQSIHLAPLELAEEMDLDQEDADEHPEHVNKWFTEWHLLDSVEPVLCSQSTPAPPEADISSAQSALPASSTYPQHHLVSPSGGIDVRPSTSGMGQTVRRTMRVDNEGSEFDSDFDDEFDMDELFDSAGTGRDIPDVDNLPEPERRIVNKVFSVIDDAADQLDGVSTSFTWEEDFSTFRGKPEVFSGPTPGPVKDYDTPYDAFTDIWSKDIIERIVLETNRYARQVIDSKIAAGTLTASSRLHQWSDTNVDEIYLLFAIYILMGLDPRTSQHEFWKASGYLQMPLFRQLMTSNRYILLSKFIHFVDNSDVSQKLILSGGVVLSAKLAKISPVVEHLNNKFSTLYNLQTDIAIDESLTLFKGRLSWVQTIRSKAARFGIKSYELCESSTGYLYTFQIHTGKNTERGEPTTSNIDLAGKSTQVVLELLQGLEHRGHLVTMDNFYNCPALARYLKSLGFDNLGTLRRNAKHVPEAIAEVPKNVPKGTIVARHCGDVSVLAWKDSRLVTMISTYHTDETFVGKRAGRNLVKPVSVRDYNRTMGGVDLKDQKLSMYLMERKRCVKWYIKIFKRLLNVSVLNAFILLSKSLERCKKPLLTHRNFREQLANSLVEAHRHVSPQNNLKAAPESQVQRLRTDLLHIPAITPGSGNRMPCRVCLRNGIRKSVHLKCILCAEYMCPESCWEAWHYRQFLPGKDIKSRKDRRRQH